MRTTHRSLLLLSTLLTAGSLVAHAGGTNTTAVPTPAGPRPGPAHWSAFDANQDGGITADEFKSVATTLVADRAAAFLKKYDSIPAGATAGDGIITTDEAKAVFQDQAADWLEHVLDLYDTNNDGQISDADTAPVHGPRGTKLVDSLDANDDGTVSTTELEAAAADQVAKKLAAFLERYDSIPTGATAGDGSITAAEYTAVFEDEVAEQVAAVLDRYDANDDGAVTADEIAAIDGVRTKGKGGRGHR